MIYLTRTALWGKMLPNFEIFICSPLNNKILMKDYKFINTKMICAYLYLKIPLVIFMLNGDPFRLRCPERTLRICISWKTADGKQTRASPPPEQMVKWYNMLPKNPSAFRVAVMVLMVEWFGVAGADEQDRSQTPLSVIDFTDLRVRVCVCARVVQTGTLVIFWLDTWNCCWSRDYNSVQRQKDREKDFIINIQESKMTFLKLELYWDLWNVFHVSHFKSDSL